MRMFFQLQEILEKFEFFPIKCRIQRALEIFQIGGKGKETDKSSSSTQMKMKVSTFPLINVIMTMYVLACGSEVRGSRMKT